uniref:Bestrophin homolog n=1 Tax=Macrostomum lignano TaxID=282301 RepID=A0A1I8JPD8_9PLAT
MRKAVVKLLLAAIPSTDHRRQKNLLIPDWLLRLFVTPPVLEIMQRYELCPDGSRSAADAADTSVDCLLSSLNDSDLLLASDVEMRPTFRQDFFQESI